LWESLKEAESKLDKATKEKDRVLAKSSGGTSGTSGQVGECAVGSCSGRYFDLSIGDSFK